MNNINSAKSYANELNLNKALRELEIDQHNPLVVCNKAGRFTAIFRLSDIKDGDMAKFARLGFMTLG